MKWKVEIEKWKGEIVDSAALSGRFPLSAFHFPLSTFDATFHSSPASVDFPV
jgi:hypothetical protein